MTEPTQNKAPLENKDDIVYVRDEDFKVLRRGSHAAPRPVTPAEYAEVVRMVERMGGKVLICERYFFQLEFSSNAEATRVAAGLRPLIGYAARRGHSLEIDIDDNQVTLIDSRV